MTDKWIVQFDRRTLVGELDGYWIQSLYATFPSQEEAEKFADDLRSGLDPDAGYREINVLRA